jgi:hypothetical protein
MMEMSHRVPPSPGTTGSGRPAGRAGAGVPGGGQVGHEPFEVGAGPRGEGRVEPLVELVDGQAPLAGGPAEHLGGVLAVGVGGAQLRGRVHAADATLAGA